MLMTALHSDAAAAEAPFASQRTCLNWRPSMPGSAGEENPSE
jgi:hypothetical protein